MELRPADINSHGRLLLEWQMLVAGGSCRAQSLKLANRSGAFDIIVRAHMQRLWIELCICMQWSAV
jgi:hypothetical protein